MMQGATLPVKYSLVASRDTVLEPSLEKTKRTGGGGATVMKLDPFLIRASPTYFKKFPFSQELTSGSKTYANTLSVGVTQTIRTGLYNGQDIEDLRPLVFDEFTVFQADGKTVALNKKSGPTNKTKVSIPVSAAGSALGNNRITIVGKTAGKQVLKTNRNASLIPLDSTNPQLPRLGNGWNNLKGPWMIGNGVKYVKDVDSSIEAFFTAPVGTKINIGLDVALDTEPGCDFLYLSVKSSAVLKTSSLAPRAVMAPRRSMGSLEGKDVKRTFPSPQSPKVFCFSQVYF
ncbi:hypothetical protein BASA61_000140 [Batrachochytrium salamandrivorans]|nr:hypothetical protein BASA61_000140 [Batrachochytrium salamandrivorans]